MFIIASVFVVRLVFLCFSFCLVLCVCLLFLCVFAFVFVLVFILRAWALVGSSCCGVCLGFGVCLRACVGFCPWLCFFVYLCDCVCLGFICLSLILCVSLFCAGSSILKRLSLGRVSCFVCFLSVSMLVLSGFALFSFVHLCICVCVFVCVCVCVRV